MDIFTQGILGAAAAQAVFGRRLPRSAWLIGFVAGLLPDADIFIRPASDPLGGLTYHRHFTHSLLFIPIGALIAALPFLLLPAWRSHRRTVYLASLLAYATHGLLDACTSYGTMLFWPFTDRRISWDLIAIIDPAFTLPLLIGVIIAVWRKWPAAARVGLVIAVAYMGFGVVQRERVLAVQRELAALRGHTIERGRVIPTPLSLMLWRSVYITSDNMIVADAVRVPYLDAPAVQVGASAPLVTLADVQRDRPGDPAAAYAFERFAWFTDGFTAYHETEPRVVGDMRYCLEPHTLDSLWGLYVGDPSGLAAGADASAHRMVSFRRNRREPIARVWAAMLGEDPAFQTLAAVRLRAGARPE